MTLDNRQKTQGCNIIYYMGSKRVFANNNNNINFNDYLKNKNGVEIIKNIKSIC